MKIDYYGTEDNYIHLKFGHARKMYNFTEAFEKQYPNFAEQYKGYWNGGGGFETAHDVIEAIERENIPVNLYFNFTDTPCESVTEAYKYLARENGGMVQYQQERIEALEKELKEKL
jgi:hypothetical protein